MSGYNNDFSDVLGQDAGGQQDGGGLRKMLEDALAMNKKLVERIEKQDREKTVAVLFKEKGLDPKVAELMGDANPEEWISKYGDLFQPAGKKLDEELSPEQKLAAQRAADQANEADQSDADLLAEREAYEAMTGKSAPQGQPSSAAQEALDKVRGFDNEADLLKYMGLQQGL